jgi:bacillithiol biosynthesis cysteine-adding enzyme BshC
VSDSTRDVPPRSNPASPAYTAVDIRRFPWVRPLLSAYAYDFPSVNGFFAGNPAEPSAWRAAVARAAARPRPNKTVAGLVEEQQLRREAPAAALVASERLRDPRTVAVVTGQQAGLFGGPLFTLLKSLTAIRLAEQVARDLGVPAVPVFWVDAEDHDWDEVRDCWVLDAELARRVVRLAPLDGAGERPVGALRLTAEAADAALHALEAVLAPTAFTGEVLAGLGGAYAAGATMADAFARWLEATLGPRGLIVFDACDPAAKPLAQPVFVRELDAPGQSLLLAAAAGAELAARGHAPQFEPAPDGTGLFYLDGGRVPIRRRGDRLAVGDRLCRREDLLAEAQDHPERFSPNVVLRPIVQDTLFPTVCYVAGPAELAYLAQLQGVYQHFGLPMPLVYPRLSVTILDAAAGRFLARYGLPLEALHAQDESALNRLLEAHLPPSVEATIEAARAAVAERMAAVIDAVPAIDPTLAGAARTTLNRMTHDLETLHAKIIHAAKRRDETLRKQFIRARAQAFPDGEQQERAVAGVYFLNRYGPALLDRILGELPLDLGRHWLVTA